MPLEEGCDKETISRNIAKLVKEDGYPQEQAVAIAMDKCKEYGMDMESVARPSQQEVHYLLKSLVKDKSCADCRWYAKDYGCHIIENNPDDVTSAGYCDRHEGKVMDTSPELLPEAPVEADTVTEMALSTEPGEPDEMGYIAPASNVKGFWQNLKEKIKGGLHPGNTIIKGTDGRRYMFIVTSNSFQDRERETIASKALHEYVDSCWKAADYFKSDNPHLVWHQDSLAVGDIVWADMAGPFLVEVAKERDGIIAHSAYDYWEQHGDALGASFRFQYRKTDRDAEGTYHRVIKKETSTLPLEAAANLLTMSIGLPPMETRNDYLNKMFGLDNAAELLKEGPEKLAAALEAKGIQHKAVDKDPVAETEKAEDTFGALLLQMIGSQADILKEFDAMRATVNADQQERTKELAAYEQRYKALETENASLRAEMKLSPRASVAAATVLTGADKAEAEKELADKQNRSNDGLDHYIRMVEGRES